MNAICVADAHRVDVLVHLVLESTRDFSGTISVSCNELGTLGAFNEQALLGKIAHALDCSIGIGKEEARDVEPGMSVRTTSFEKLIQELADMYPPYVLNRKGLAIREQAFEGDAGFLMTDHIPMPKDGLNG